MRGRAWYTYLANLTHVIYRMGHGVVKQLLCVMWFCHCVKHLKVDGRREK